MDGNRRWASRQGAITAYGHQEGVHAAKRVVEFCLRKKIRFLSLYTFSIENFRRSASEKSVFFELIAHQAVSELEFLKKQGIRICFIGDRDLFPASLVSVCDSVEAETKDGAILQVNLLFCYGSRQEIVGGIKKIIAQVKAGLLSADDISEESFSDYLWTHGIPEPDLIVRTGGSSRLSNFLLYQAAYSELYFLDCLWPEVTAEHLERVISLFNTCQRNFGT